MKEDIHDHLLRLLLLYNPNNTCIVHALRLHPFSSITQCSPIQYLTTVSLCLSTHFCCDSYPTLFRPIIFVIVLAPSSFILPPPPHLFLLIYIPTFFFASYNQLPLCISFSFPLIFYLFVLLSASSPSFYLVRPSFHSFLFFVLFLSVVNHNEPHPFTPLHPTSPYLPFPVFFLVLRHTQFLTPYELNTQHILFLPSFLCPPQPNPST